MTTSNLSIVRNTDQLVIILVQFRIYDAEELSSNLGTEPGEGLEINPRYLAIIVVINNDAPIM